MENKESDNNELAALYRSIANDIKKAKPSGEKGPFGKSKILGRFRGSNKTISQEELSAELFKEQIAEQRQRRRFRNLMFWSFLTLLILQHAGLVFLIYRAIEENFIKDIQALLGVIVSATLGETYAIIQIMVKFIFSPGNFNNISNKPKT